jgi:hypothetical protein
VYTNNFWPSRKIFWSLENSLGRPQTLPKNKKKQEKVGGGGGGGGGPGVAGCAGAVGDAPRRVLVTGSLEMRGMARGADNGCAQTFLTGGMHWWMVDERSWS